MVLLPLGEIGKFYVVLFGPAQVLETPAACGICIMPVLGIGFHSFIDGIVYSVTYKVSLFTGTLAAVGMVLHEFPEGIVISDAGREHKTGEQASLVLGLVQQVGRAYVRFW